MKRQKLRIKIEPKKTRKTWEINPVSRAHSEQGYSRGREKEELRKLVDRVEDEEIPGDKG